MHMCNIVTVLILLTGNLVAQEDCHRLTWTLNQSIIDKAIDTAPSWPFMALNVDDVQAESRTVMLANETNVVRSIAAASIRQMEEFAGTMDKNATAAKWQSRCAAFMSARRVDNSTERRLGHAKGNELESMLFKRDERQGMIIASKSLAEYVAANPTKFSAATKKAAQQVRESSQDNQALGTLWMNARKDLDGDFAKVRNWVKSRTKRHILVRHAAVEWIQHQVTRRPTIALGNPLTIAELSVTTACRVRVDYSWRGINGGHTQTMFLSCHGFAQKIRASLLLSASRKTRVSLTPSVGNVWIPLRSMGIDFRCNVADVTNAELAARPLTVLDLSGLTLPFGDVKMKLAIKSLRVHTSPNRVRLEINLQ